MGKPIDVKNFCKNANTAVRWSMLPYDICKCGQLSETMGVMVSDVGCESGDPLTIPADVDLRQVQQQIPKNICENGSTSLTFPAN